MRFVRRRQLVVAASAFLAVPPVLLAQPAGKISRIAFLGVGTASGYVKEVEAIRGRLRELGYAEGRNIALEFRWADGNPERLAAMASELAALNVDVIITHAVLGTRAAAQATKSIPIIIADGPDPVAGGFAASLARPGGNITGSTAFQIELAAKRLELLHETFPRLKRMAVLFNTANTNNEPYFDAMRSSGDKMNVRLERFLVDSIEALPQAFAAMARKRMEAVVIGEDPFLNTNAGVIAALAAFAKIPACGLSVFPDAGGLLGYGANRPLLYARAANFVDKILKGAKPGDLPIERATKFDLVINLKVAKALGVIIPREIITRADRVIE